MELVTLKALAPVAGSYICPIAECDEIEDYLTDSEDGVVVKKKRGRKRFQGLVSVERRATLHEIEAAIEGRLPANIEVLSELPKKAASDTGLVFAVTILEHAPPFAVPAEMADSLIKRGLAELAS